jgi:hypothetical protein
MTSPPSPSVIAAALKNTTATTDMNPAPADNPQGSSVSPSTFTNRKRKHREDDGEHSPGTTDAFSRYTISCAFYVVALIDSNCRPVKKLRRLPQIPVPTAMRSHFSNLEAYHEAVPLKWADRVLIPVASEVLEELVEKLDNELDINEMFHTNEETSFPRKDYTPYVTFVDCRYQGHASSHLGSLSSNDTDDE